MGFNFPNTPTVGDLYPTPALPGVPQYRWDGAVWTTTTYDPLTWVQRAGDTMTGALNVVTPPTLPAHAASKAYVDALGVASAPLNALNYSGMQVNGDFSVQQEYGATAGTGTGRRFSDNWMCAYSGTMVIQSGVGATGPYPFPFLGYANTTTGQPSLGSPDYASMQTYIEGYRIARLNWGTGAPNAQPITIGFWSFHSRPGLYCIGLRNADATRGCVGTYTHNVSNQVEWKTVTFPGCPDGVWNITNGIGVAIHFMMAAGTAYNAPAAGVWYSTAYLAVAGQTNAVQAANDVIRIMGVVVLPGIYAPTAAQSPLIMRPYDQELVTCKRYLRIITPEGAGLGNTATAYFTIRHDGMRATPTISAKDILVVTDVFAANYIQSSAHAGAAGNFPDYGMYIFGNFTIGATKAVIFQPGSNSNQNRVMFDARL